MTNWPPWAAPPTPPRRSRETRVTGSLGVEVSGSSSNPRLDTLSPRHPDTLVLYPWWHHDQLADGGEPDGKEGGEAAAGAGDDHAAQADAFGEKTANQCAEGEGAPDDG